VWDLPLRLAHWALVLALGGSWLTAELGVEYREYHFWCGYAVLSIVLFRLMWGLVGTRYARFTQFLASPPTVVRYARGLFSKPAAPGYGAGHNPLGGLAVIALLVLLGVQIGTGLFTDDDILYTGPYQPAVDAATVKWLSGLHHSNFDYLLAMVGLHLLAVAFYQFRRGQRLTRAIKPMAEFGGEAPIPLATRYAVWLRGALVFGIAIALVVALVYLAPEPVYDDYYY